MKKSRLLNEVHETALGLARIGAIDQHTLRELDALCLPPVRELSAKQIRAIRGRARMNRALRGIGFGEGAETIELGTAGTHPGLRVHPRTGMDHAQGLS